MAEVATADIERGKDMSVRYSDTLSDSFLTTNIMVGNEDMHFQ